MNRTRLRRAFKQGFNVTIFRQADTIVGGTGMKATVTSEVLRHAYREGRILTGFNVRVQ